MEAILPFKIKNEQMFFESALKVGFDEMGIYKFIYIMQVTDLDIFPKMNDERINMLIYGWEVCEDYKQNINPNEWELPEELETVLKLLVPWSMDIWFSKEWDKCKYHLKNALLHCLNRARDLLMRIPDMMQINWDLLLLYKLKPWNVLYLKNLNVTKEKTLESGAQNIEIEEMRAAEEDISYVKLEQLPIIVLRLVKLFDQCSIDMVKTLCMRVIAAWNKIHQAELESSGSRRPYVPPEDKKCLMLICHIYLMAVYESDDDKGYVIDNMINNIRFYYQGFQDSTPLHMMHNLEYTPARYIALTNIYLRVQKRDFFDFFIWNKYDTALVNLFGVVSQAYKSYLLGNLLMELNNMNEDDFASNIPLYKRLMNSYVNEREKSELFLLNEIDKLEAQHYAYNINQIVKGFTDFKSKICKGNRMSNIGNYENSDDTVTPLADTNNDNNNSEDNLCEIETEIVVVGDEMEDEQERVRIKESELRLDPVFQNLPNNESILYYVYDVLAKKDYKGWHFAKIVLLVKIIGCEQNMIETWRYHPGLTTDFMLNLEVKLSHHFVDLAKIFKDHPFLEQEFWLTAFYLDPTAEIFETIKRLGMRNNRKRTDEHIKMFMSINNVEAKYGLLSSTIDVKELASMSNTDDPTTDYDPLFSALHSLRVSDSLVKDMLTAIFLPRNRSFAWSVDWVILRNRCKRIMNSSIEKKRFVDLNMAEANERLNYLIIDYERYKNRPQLDYGTIEEGYENLMAGGEFDKESEEEEEEEEDFEDDEDVYESKKRGRGSLTAAARKKEDDKVEEDNSQEDDPFLMGKRRTRARTAATLASFLFQTLPRSTRRKKNQKLEEDEKKADEEKIAADNDDKFSDSKSPIITATLESPIPSPPIASSDQKDTQFINAPIENLKECLKKRPAYLNTTQGFENLIDIWNVEKSELQLIDENCVSLMESSAALQIAVKLKLLNKEINPLGCDETEYIDDAEMLIHNAEYAIKREYEIDVQEENVATYRIMGTNIETSVENAKPSYLQQVKVEAPVEEVLDYETTKTSDILELPLVDENSRETTNSDMSTYARKDSGEVSEAITDSKHNVDTEMQEIEIEVEQESTAATENYEMKMEYEEISGGTEKYPDQLSAVLAEEEENKPGENSSSKTGIKIPEEAKNDDNEGQQTKDNFVSESNDLLIKNDANEKPFVQETIEKRTNNTGEKIVSLKVLGEKCSDKKHVFGEQPILDTETNDWDKKLLENFGNIVGEADNEANNTGILESLANIANKINEQIQIRLKNDIDSNAVASHSIETDHMAVDSVEANNSELKSNAIESVEAYNSESQRIAVDAGGTTDTTESISLGVESTKTENSDLKPMALDADGTDNTEFKTIMEDLIADAKVIGAESIEKNNSASVEVDDSKPKTIKTELFETNNSKSDTVTIDSVEQNKSNLKKAVTADSIETKESSQEASTPISETQLGEVELKSIEAKTSITNDSLLSIALYYSSSDEWNETDATQKDQITEVTKLAADQATDQKEEVTTTDCNKPTEALIDPTNRETSEAEESSDDDETRHLKELCLTKNAKVLLRRLCSDDFVSLRQPKIKLQRVRYEKYAVEFRAKRRCIEGKVYLEFDDSSNSNNSYGANSSSSEVYHPTRIKRKIPIRRHIKHQPRTSDSDNDTMSSDDFKLSTLIAIARKQRLSTPSTSQSSTSQHVTGPKSARKYGPKSARKSGPKSVRKSGPKSVRKSGPKSVRQKTGPKSSKHKLMVTPRSASGLKMRISNAEQNRQEARVTVKRPRPIVYDEIIQLSSSSNDTCSFSGLSGIEEEVIEIEIDHPLFEEEIII